MITLLLSKVVHETDSCSSFTGWKLRNIDVEHKEQIIETQMTTTKLIDIETSHNSIKNTSRMYRLITEPIILPREAILERCEEEFEQAFCHNHGKCYEITDSRSPNDKERFCLCDRGYGDKQCTNKLPDGEYRTIKDRSDINKKVPVTTTIKTTTEIETKIWTSTERNIANEHHYGHKVPCPEPYDQDFCIHGECFMFSGLINNYVCVCNDDFTGLRCESKVPDYHYETRPRRDIPGSRKKKKIKMKRRFRTVT